MTFGIYEIEPQVGDGIAVEGFSGAIEAVMKSFDGSIRYVVRWSCYQFRTIIIEPDQIESLTRGMWTVERKTGNAMGIDPSTRFITSAC